MGEMEDSMYAANSAYADEAYALARKILRHGKFISRDLYKYNGQHYWVFNGRVLTREQGERLERERNRELRNQLKDHGAVKTR